MAKRGFLGLFTTEAAPRRNSDSRDDYRSDESEYYNDEYDSTPEYEDTYSSRRGRAGSDDDEVYYTNLDRSDVSASAPVSSSARQDQSKNITQISTGSSRRRGAIGSTVVYVDPEEVNFASPLIDYLKDNMTIVLSLAKTKDDKEGRRIVDFMSGAACYAEATIQRVAPQTFIITPKGVENLDKRSGN